MLQSYAHPYIDSVSYLNYLNKSRLLYHHNNRTIWFFLIEWMTNDGVGEVKEIKYQWKLKSFPRRGNRYIPNNCCQWPQTGHPYWMILPHRSPQPLLFINLRFLLEQPRPGTWLPLLPSGHRSRDKVWCFRWSCSGRAFFGGGFCIVWSFWTLRGCSWGYWSSLAFCPPYSSRKGSYFPARTLRTSYFHGASNVSS